MASSTSYAGLFSSGSPECYLFSLFLDASTFSTSIISPFSDDELYSSTRSKNVTDFCIFPSVSLSDLSADNFFLDPFKDFIAFCGGWTEDAFGRLPAGLVTLSGEEPLDVGLGTSRSS